MKTRGNFVLFFIAGITLLSFYCSDKSTDPDKQHTSTGIIDADHAHIEYIGRFDRSNPKRVIFDWPGVTIRARFEGTSCALRLIDGNNYYAVTVDESEPQILATDTASVYSAVSNLTDTIHTIMIQKRTEAFVGKGEFLGFILNEGKALAEPEGPRSRRIEFIGNSITCGYGVEGKSASEPFKPETENATLSYAGMTARALNADYSLIAISGRGMVRNYGDTEKTSEEPLPSAYDRTCYFNQNSVWNFDSWIPQAVVINLGTNDYSTQPHPDKSVFESAYQQLIRRIQTQYSDVTIFCVCGPMIGEPCASNVANVVEQCRQTHENKAVHFINLGDTILALNDRGSDWHPNISGQQKTANIVIPAIEETMNW